MDNDIIKELEELKSYTHSTIGNLQKAYIPSIYEFKVEKRHSFYGHHNYHSLYKEDCLLFLCSNMPFTHKNQENHIYAKPLLELIDKGYVHPVLIFVNNKFIKWSNITIIYDCKYTYILIKNIEDSDRYTTSCKGILLPTDVTYSENCSKITKETYFAFDDNGLSVLLTEDVESGNYTLIESQYRNIKVFHEEIHMTENMNQMTTLPTKYNLSNNNIILFKNGLLNTDSVVRIVGLNVFSVDNNVFGNNEVCKVFYNLNTKLSKDNITNVLNVGQFQNDVKESTNNIYTNGIFDKFDFTPDSNLSYDENMNMFLKYTSNYNTNLLSNIYIDKCNVRSRNYTGYYLKSKEDDKKELKLSRNIEGSLDCYVIVFKNGLLYEHNKRIRYEHKNFILSTDGLENTDVIEIIYFKNVDNRISNIVCDSLSIDDIQIIDNTINLDDCELFSNTISDGLFNVDDNSLTKYSIDFDYERLKNGKCKIYPLDNYYFDKALTLVSKRQFRHMNHIVNKSKTYVELTNDFLYCDIEDNYMIFINNRFIPKSDYNITISRPSNPFKSVSIYLDIILNKDDEIDIYYLPININEVYKVDSIPLTGLVKIDRTNINFDFNPSLYFVFLNGKKICVDELKPISSNRFKIIGNTTSVRNLVIISHFEENSILTELFNSYNSTIDKTYDSLNENLFKSLYNYGNDIQDIERDMKLNELSKDKRLYKIIKDHYAVPNVNDGDVFPYDLIDDIRTNEIDNDGNMIIGLLDANKEDKLDLEEE